MAGVSFLQMYDVTLQALKAARIERMWFVVSMKLARLHVDARRITQACALITELHKYAVDIWARRPAVAAVPPIGMLFTHAIMCSYCTIPGTDQDDPSKAAQLIEIYAMRIEVRELRVGL